MQRQAILVCHLVGDFVCTVIPELAALTDFLGDAVVQEQQVVDDVLFKQAYKLFVFDANGHEAIALDGINGLPAVLGVCRHRLQHCLLINGEHLRDGVIGAFNAGRVLRGDFNLVFDGGAFQAKFFFARNFLRVFFWV